MSLSKLLFEMEGYSEKYASYDFEEEEWITELENFYDHFEFNRMSTNQIEDKLKQYIDPSMIIGKGRHRVSVAISETKVAKITSARSINENEHRVFKCLGPKFSPIVYYNSGTDEKNHFGIIVVERVSNDISKVRRALLKLFDINGVLAKLYDEKPKRSPTKRIDTPYHFSTNYNNLSISKDVAKIDNTFSPLKNPKSRSKRKGALLDNATEEGKQWLADYAAAVKKCGFSPFDLGVYGFGVRESTGEIVIIDGGNR
jgi:hypothetical protein